MQCHRWRQRVQHDSHDAPDAIGGDDVRGSAVGKGINLGLAELCADHTLANQASNSVERKPWTKVDECP